MSAASTATLSALAAHHLPLAAMLGTAWFARRSLGAMPPLAAALIGALAMPFVLGGDADPLSLASAFLPPLAIFGLARSQAIPGLRRERMSDEQRARWIARHAFGPAPARAARQALPNRI